MFLASDVPALLEHTREVLFLEDGDIAELTRDGVTVTDLEGRKRDAHAQDHHLVGGAGREGGLPALHAQGDPRAAAGGDRHPARAAAARQERRHPRRLRGAAGRQAGGAAGLRDLVPRRAGGQVPDRDRPRASPARWTWPASSATASRWWGRTTWWWASRQSGETADTLAAIKEAKSRGARTLAICNVVDSAIARTCDGALYTHAGPEIGVASTKCFTAQLAALSLLAIHIGRRTGALSDPAAAELILRAAADPAEDVLRPAGPGAA